MKTFPKETKSPFVVAVQWIDDVLPIGEVEDFIDIGPLDGSFLGILWESAWGDRFIPATLCHHWRWAYNAAKLHSDRSGLFEHFPLDNTFHCVPLPCRIKRVPQ